MTPEVKYERIGKLIFGACRHDGGIADVYSWMVDELGIAGLDRKDDVSNASLQAAYLVKYASDEQFDESHRCFMETMALRGS